MKIKHSSYKELIAATPKSGLYISPQKTGATGFKTPKNNPKKSIL
jgi:hypothetical protein